MQHYWESTSRDSGSGAVIIISANKMMNGRHAEMGGDRCSSGNVAPLPAPQYCMWWPVCLTGSYLTPTSPNTERCACRISCAARSSTSRSDLEGLLCAIAATFVG